MRIFFFLILSFLFQGVSLFAQTSRSDLEKRRAALLNEISETQKILTETKKAGFAVSYEEITDSVTAISAPVYYKDKLAIGAVSISGPKYRFNEERIKTFTTKLLNATKEIAMTFE